MKKKLYEINGVLTYAHCYYLEIEAKSKKEATEIAKTKIGSLIDPAVAEYQDYIMDKPRIIED